MRFIPALARRCLWSLAFAGMALAMGACLSLSKSATPAMEEMSRVSGVPLERLQRGHGIYLTQCGQCHELVKPENLKVSDWRMVMPGMCWSAGLTRADEALLLEYVLAAKSAGESKKKGPVD
ncbi:MAG: hypothetical protein ACO3RK_03580 [Luteolibacter sp.]